MARLTLAVGWTHSTPTFQSQFSLRAQLPYVLPPFAPLRAAAAAPFALCASRMQGCSVLCMRSKGKLIAALGPRFPGARSAHPRLFSLKTGDSLFVPTGWPHAVYTVVDTIMVTSEYINPYPLAAATENMETLGMLTERNPELDNIFEGYRSIIDQIMHYIPDNIAATRSRRQLIFVHLSYVTFCRYATSFMECLKKYV